MPIRDWPRGHRRCAVIDGSELLAIHARRSLVPKLHRCCTLMRIAFGEPLFGRRRMDHAAGSAVVAHAYVVLDHGAVVGVVHARHVDASDGCVVDEVTRVPISAVVADAEIAEAVIDAAVVADARSPVTGMPRVDGAGPRPVTRRPQRP